MARCRNRVRAIDRSIVRAVILGAIKYPTTLILRWLAFRVLDHQRIQGFDLYLDPNVRRLSASPNILSEKFAEAIEIIGEIDGRRLRNLKAYLPRIVIARPFLGRFGEYSHDLRAALLSPDFVADRPATSVALLLIHEATHARLRRGGFRYLPPVRARHERICVDAEIDFAQRLPPSPDRESRLSWLREKRERWRSRELES